MDTYSYRIDDKIYINLTNKCSNSCGFCVRITDSYKEYGLWLSKEPTAEEVINSFEDLDSAKEVVFCGYGEPIYRIDAIIEICKFLHNHGKKTRLNTNGQGLLIVGEDCAKRLAGYIDTVSISLNAATAKKYQEICHSEFGEKAFFSLLSFAEECKKYIPRVILSIVDVVGEEEVTKAKELADKLGITLRVRAFIE